MGKWLWLGGAVLLAVASGATWFAFSNPAFVAGLASAAVAAAGRAVWSFLKAQRTDPNAAKRSREGLERKPGEGR